MLDEFFSAEKDTVTPVMHDELHVLGWAGPEVASAFMYKVVKKQMNEMSARDPSDSLMLQLALFNDAAATIKKEPACTAATNGNAATIKGKAAAAANTKGDPIVVEDDDNDVVMLDKTDPATPAKINVVSTVGECSGSAYRKRKAMDMDK